MQRFLCVSSRIHHASPPHAVEHLSWLLGCRKASSTSKNGVPSRSHLVVLVTVEVHSLVGYVLLRRRLHIILLGCVFFAMRFAILIDVSYCFLFCFVQLGTTDGSLHLVDLAGDTTAAEAGEYVEESEVRSPAEGFRDRVCNPPSAVCEC